MSHSVLAREDVAHSEDQVRFDLDRAQRATPRAKRVIEFSRHGRAERTLFSKLGQTRQKKKFFKPGD